MMIAATAPHYQIYQALFDASYPARSTARALAPWLRQTMFWLPDNCTVRKLTAMCEAVALAGLTHERPSFGIDAIEVDGQKITVHEEATHVTPFATLLHFCKDTPNPGPKVLLIAPISGHFATLLTSTARTLLQHHDVYITDWHNIRDVPLSAGTFGMDAFIDHLIGFIDWLGPETHLVSVCQPTVGTLAAVAVMAAAQSPNQPRSMTLMAGPIDCRINPSVVNKLATEKPIEWFEQNLIGLVPLRYKGALRRVYPGYMQISAFLSMNAERHMDSFRNMFSSRVSGDHTKAESIRDFYAEYLAMMDMSAEFYLETVRFVFQEHALPQGKLEYRGTRVNPAAIRRTALFTIEGEKDDICSIGQTLSAHDLCSKLAPYRKQHHLQPGAGHYGVFNGKRWERQIYPRVRAFIHDFDE
ncbi:poly(3-hydroxybutyrate) depolymerase [Rugosibacter aromaticivorans]|uniref:Poly(3-hydroxybutyrate) depolymerase n=1 Tax=Rugosibacter aromaticivorans TaxID=1565605 RepID=A0A0C5J722_9PROT|nr:polyhydroxyalkanoate depolymerase [Rugosibacter aromaticivorans]AJP47518.1 poly(3-hydroxybutyrate) depolymerase [Rugosibacter aromaticivorans]